MQTNVHKSVQVVQINFSQPTHTRTGCTHLVIYDRVEHTCHLHALGLHAHGKFEILLAEEETLCQQPAFTIEQFRREK